MKRELAALFAGALFCHSSAAVFLTSEGKAPIRHNDLSTARYLATLDAMNQASLENGAQVTSDTIMNNLAIRSDTVRIRTQGKVGQVHMLQEWQEDGIYHVRISAEVSDNPLNCGSPTALIHNKRIGITQFINDAVHDSADLRNPEKGLAQMMLRQINRSRALRGVDLSDYAIDSIHHGEQQDQVQQLARQSGVQFILVGHLTQARGNAVGDLAESGLMKDFSTLLNISQQVVSARDLEIEAILYDGESGDVIAQQQHGTTVYGDTYVGRNQHFGSHGFIDTRTGAGFQELVAGLVQRLSAELTCQPMTTTIESIDGNVVTLPVGRNAGIHSGDRLVVVQKGNPLNILGTLQITQVSGTRASGMTDVDAETLGITITDLVRSW